MSTVAIHQTLRSITTRSPSHWITRERPKIDRIAVPWLILRFIDSNALFHFVPAQNVMDEATRRSAIPFDVVDVRFTHRGESCSFDTVIEEFGLADLALRDLAISVRAADTGHPEASPQAAGLLAISLGLSHNFVDDHEMLRHGLVIYDALYAWCRDVRGETHGWPPKT